MRINHWVKAETKGELRVPHRTLDARNSDWSQTDMWEYQCQELDFSTWWAEVGRIIFRGEVGGEGRVCAGRWGEQTC